MFFFFKLEIAPGLCILHYWPLTRNSEETHICFLHKKTRHKRLFCYVGRHWSGWISSSFWMYQPNISMFKLLRDIFTYSRDHRELREFLPFSQKYVHIRCIILLDLWKLMNTKKISLQICKKQILRLAKVNEFRNFWN